MSDYQMIGFLGRKGEGKTTLMKYVLLAQARRNPVMPIVVVDPMGNFRSWHSDVLIPQPSYDLSNKGRVVDGAQALIEYTILYKTPAVLALDDVANIKCITANLQSAQGKNQVLVNLSTGNRHGALHVLYSAQSRIGQPKAWSQNADVIYMFQMDDDNAVKDLVEYKGIKELPVVVRKLPKFHCVKIFRNPLGGNQFQIINAKPFLDFVIREEQNAANLPDVGTAKWRLDTHLPTRK